MLEFLKILAIAALVIIGAIIILSVICIIGVCRMSSKEARMEEEYELQQWANYQGPDKDKDN